MALLRHVLLVVAGLAATASMFAPLQEVDIGHPYGHSCSDPFQLAWLGLFLPSMLIALIAAARMRTALRANQPGLPRAVLGRQIGRGRARSAMAALDGRLAASGRFPRIGRIAAWLVLVLGTGLLLPGCDGPGKLAGAASHLVVFALVVMQRPPPR